jgi:serine/threonine protein kinase
MEKVHAAGFLHRDIKPDNIFVREGGDPVLIDFGSARASAGQTRTLTTMVTPGYAPFEQYSSGSPQGPYTDIYAMGGVLLLRRHRAQSPGRHRRMKGDPLEDQLAPAKIHYDEQFLAAISWAMAVDDKRRPQTVAEWRERCWGRRCARAAGGDAEGGAQRGSRRGRRHRTHDRARDRDRPRTRRTSASSWRSASSWTAR